MRFVDRVAVEDEGEGLAVVVCVHGPGGSSNSWTPAGQVDAHDAVSRERRHLNLARMVDLKGRQKATFVSPRRGRVRSVPADWVVRLPAAVEDEAAASLLPKGITADFLLRDLGHVGRGTRLLVHAAAGGVGLLVCAWAKSLGAVVLGTVSSKAKGRVAREHGCEHVIVKSLSFSRPAVFDYAETRAECVWAALADGKIRLPPIERHALGAAAAAHARLESRATVGALILVA